MTTLNGGTDEPATFYWRSFSDLADKPDVRLHPNGYVVIDLGTDPYLNIHLHTRTQCDVVVKAFLLAKDLLPAPEGSQP